MRVKFSKKEKKHLIITIIILSFVFSFKEWGTTQFSILVGLSNWIQYLIAIAIILVLKQTIHKIIAEKQGASAEYRMWSIERYGLKKSAHFSRKKKEGLPIGLILSITLAFLTNGALKFAAVCSSKMKEESRIGKKYKNLTEIEISINSLIGILATLFVATLFQVLTLTVFNFDKIITVGYAIAIYSMIPFSSLDGAKIFIGSKILYLISLAFIILIIVLIPTMNVTATILLALLTSIFISLIYFYNLSKN